MKWKNIRYILVLGIMLSICILMLSGCGKDDKVDLSDTVITSMVSYGEDTWEIHKGTMDNKIYTVKNGEVKNSKTEKSGEINTMISLPSVETSKDLDKSVELTDNTYKSGIVASLEYLNFLEESGYTPELTAKTPLFFEVYLKTDKMDKYKRLIITKEYIVEYNTDSINFDIADYII